jgi:hypothetical protein
LLIVIRVFFVDGFFGDGDGVDRVLSGDGGLRISFAAL